MGEAYTKKEREKKRVVFAKNLRAGHSIRACAAKANISVSTVYAWNKGDGWTKGSAWDKAGGWSTTA